MNFHNTFNKLLYIFIVYNTHVNAHETHKRTNYKKKAILPNSVPLLTKVLIDVLSA